MKSSRMCARPPALLDPAVGFGSFAVWQKADLPTFFFQFQSPPRHWQRSQGVHSATEQCKSHHCHRVHPFSLSTPPVENDQPSNNPLNSSRLSPGAPACFDCFCMSCCHSTAMSMNNVCSRASIASPAKRPSSQDPHRLPYRNTTFSTTQITCLLAQGCMPAKCHAKLQARILCVTKWSYLPGMPKAAGQSCYRTDHS